MKIIKKITETISNKPLLAINKKEVESIKSYDSSIRYGIKSLIIFAVLFLSWGAFLPIKSASIADGLVVLDFNRKTIQHLEGGIIDKILVKEGQKIKEGEVILYIHDIKEKSEHEILQERFWTSKLQKERLLSEKNNKKSLNLDGFFKEIGEVYPYQEEKIKDIASNQIRLFKARTDRKIGEISVLNKKLQSSKTKLKIFKQEFELIKPLVDEDNLSILREFELQKSISELEFEVEIAKLQIVNYENDFLSEVLKEIKENDIEIVTAINQLDALGDVLKRSAVISPVSGKIMNIKYHTIGAVVPPGGDVVEIVPENEELIIEAKIKPTDIDNITVGMEAKVMLTAYKGKKVPKLNGKVLNISPDINIDEKSSESYFIARIKTNKEEIESLKHKIELYPGMPAQVFIINDSRSLISYLFSPIKDSAYKAFRED